MSWRGLAERLLPLRWQSEAAILRHRAIPDALWHRTTALYPFLLWRSAARQQRLRDLTTLFLARKQFVPAGGLALTDDIAVAIAAQACLPILQFGLRSYAAFTSIVVHPSEVLAKREVLDDAGVVHHYEEVVAGEAMMGGPIMLSWQDVQQAQDPSLIYNVVVHEFVHALDMLNGEVDGVPPLPPHIDRSHWVDTLWQAFDRQRDALAHGDPVWLDPYAVDSGLDEFFPVVAEAFFVAPQQLRQHAPELHALLASYFGEDPAVQAPPALAPSTD